METSRRSASFSPRSISSPGSGGMRPARKASGSSSSPVWLARLEVAGHGGARGLDGAGAQAHEVHRRAVEDAGVAGAVAQPDGMVGDSLVQVPPRGMTSLGQGELVVAGAPDPLSRRGRGGPRPQGVLKGPDGGGGLRPAVYRHQAGRVGHQVDVGVDEPGEEGLSRAVDGARASRPDGGDVGVGADQSDPSGADRDRLRLRPALVQREDVGVVEDEVGPSSGVRHRATAPGQAATGSPTWTWARGG